MQTRMAKERNEAPPSLTLLWCQTGVLEEEWIRFLFSGWRLTERRIPDLDPLEENSLLVLSSNVHPLDRLDPAFLRKVSSLPRIGLFHLSDEWFCGGYEAYRHFRFILRNYHARLFAHPGICVVPLGWTNGTQEKEEADPASRRRSIWTFAGNRNWARHQMVAELVHVVPNQVRLSQPGGSPPLSREEYLSWLRDAAFCPCPMGNVVLETFRVYEALEAGCIPIVEHRFAFDYFRSLLGENPLPSVRSWGEGASYMRRLASDPASLDASQREIRQWWRFYKAKLQREVGEFVLRGLAGEWERSLVERWRFRSGLGHDVRRRVELLRHHSLGAALDRANRGVRERGLSILWRGGPRFKEKGER
ncbi:exostosin family protein [Methylacidimicrobium sp. B4]|uniref:exostosin domain-containing protein n=1 Tax=Methylacidimicrobium sp. B4 TaxID=2796139 RepID=UPI001A902577|nr:exostosin family protein [Methylacidimicrobium sp. B4]QSR85446.1 exostosin family protein [Methylacidimicrobium sp. B4]